MTFVLTIGVYFSVFDRKILNANFNDLYFMPDLPELKEVNIVLKKYMSGQFGSVLSQWDLYRIFSFNCCGYH